MSKIDARYQGTGGMPYNSPEGRAYREAQHTLMFVAGNDKPDPTAVYELATEILHAAEAGN
jgi:hypothetical protein